MPVSDSPPVAKKMKPSLRNFLVVTVFGAMALLLLLRGYGYYTNDQSAFLHIADAVAATGRPVAAMSDGAYFGNFHPPLMVITLGILIKYTSVFLAPAALQMICIALSLLLLLSAQKRFTQDLHAFGPAVSLASLFILLPLTHECFLFLDIDNTVLVLWGALLLYALSRYSNRPAWYGICGLVFAAGFWCKLTTPLLVIVVWAVLDVLRSRTKRNVLNVLLTILIAAAVFSVSYFLYCRFSNLPATLPFTITFGKFTSEIHGASSPFARLGNALRSMYFDAHWFTPVLFLLAVLSTVRKMKEIKNGLTIEAYTYFFFWAIWIGYTFFIPTSDLPRYKYGALPFLLFVLWEDFYRFANGFSWKEAWGIACGTSLLFFVLPDFATSGQFHELHYHSFGILKIPFQYDPPWFVDFLHSASRISKVHWYAFPFRPFLFCAHYFSCAVVYFAIIYLTLYSAVAAGIRRTLHRRVWTVAVLVWSVMFLQDLSREYQLFYDAGRTGFPQTVSYLKNNLKPGEQFLGYKDLAFYVHHFSVALYRWEGNRLIDTASIDTISRNLSIRYVAYCNGDFYGNDRPLSRYLKEHCDLVFTAGDYLVWKFRSDRPSFISAF